MTFKKIEKHMTGTFLAIHYKQVRVTASLEDWGRKAMKILKLEPKVSHLGSACMVQHKQGDYIIYHAK